MFGTYRNMASVSHWTDTKLKSACDPQIDLPVLSPRMSVPQTPFYCFWEGMSDTARSWENKLETWRILFLFLFCQFGKICQHNPTDGILVHLLTEIWNVYMCVSELPSQKCCFYCNTSCRHLKPMPCKDEKKTTTRKNFIL